MTDVPVFRRTQGMASVQSTRPRDLGALVLVLGILAILFIVSLALGRPGLR